MILKRKYNLPTPNNICSQSSKIWWDTENVPNDWTTGLIVNLPMGFTTASAFRLRLGIFSESRMSIVSPIKAVR